MRNGNLAGFDGYHDTHKQFNRIYEEWKLTSGVGSKISNFGSIESMRNGNQA